MPIELITGHAGTTHISSEDAGAFNAAMFGKDSYVLGAAPELQFTNANTLSIAPCELLLQGRHVRLTGVNLVTIESGSQTGLRNDIVYIEYVKDSSGVESTEIKVVRGETGTTAKDPALPHPSSILDGAETADIPIARVKLDKLTPSVEWLLDDVVDEQPKNILKTQVWNDISVKAFSKNNVVTVIVRREGATGSALSTGNFGKIGEIDSKFKPAADCETLIGVGGNAARGAWLYMCVNTKGEVGIRHMYGASEEQWGAFSGTITYVTAGSGTK